MTKTAAGQQRTINEIYNLIKVVGIILVFVLLITFGGFWLRDRADKQQAAERRANICEAADALYGGQVAFINGNEAFLESIYAPDENDTPEEAAEIRARIEEGRRQYHAFVDPSLEIIEPALENCGTTR